MNEPYVLRLFYSDFIELLSLELSQRKARNRLSAKLEPDIE